MPDHNTGVPIAAPHDPTSLVWETLDDHTVRVVMPFDDIEDADPGDGIPSAIAPEQSSTVAVVIVDLYPPLSWIGDVAQANHVGLDVIQIPGPIGNGAIGLLVSRWKEFQGWFPERVKEVEPLVFRTYEHRRAMAIMYRLRLLADEIQRRTPPNNLDFCALRIEG